jgi:hypothetical protein
MFSAVRSACLIAGLTALIVPFGVFAQTGPVVRPAPPPPQLQGDPTFYYQRPFDIPTFLVSWENAGRPGRDGVMGFLTGVFAKDPARVRAVTHAQIEPRTQPVVTMALMLAGKTPEAKDAAQRWGWPPERMAKIAGMPPLLSHKIERPDQFDLLWGASFATADPVYVRPIYNYLETTASTPGIDAEDIVALIVLRARPNKQAMEALGRKYPREIFIRLVVASSALWSLESNGRQHKFVAAALDAFAKEKPGSPAAKAINDLRAQIARR